MISYFYFPKHQPSVVWRGLGQNGQKQQQLTFVETSLSACHCSHHFPPVTSCHFLNDLLRRALLLSSFYWPGNSGTESVNNLAEIKEPGKAEARDWMFRFCLLNYVYGRENDCENKAFDFVREGEFFLYTHGLLAGLRITGDKFMGEKNPKVELHTHRGPLIELRPKEVTKEGSFLDILDKETGDLWEMYRIRKAGVWEL